MFCIFSTGLFAQEIRASIQIGQTSTLYHNEMIYGISYSVDHLYLSGGGTSNPKYDYHSYIYVNGGYVFDVNKYFTVGPIIGYAFQKGYKKDHNLFNYGVVMQGVYPTKHNYGYLVNFEFTRHHTNFGVGVKLNL